jgi:tetratricopeptide (TPR) repeat protein
VELLHGILYGCVFLAAIRVSLREGGSRFLEVVVIGSAVGLAIVTLAHSSIGAERVFGLYKPHDMQGYVVGRIGPLLNPNHVAAYANMGACVAAGVALEERQLTGRIVAAAGALLLAGTSVWAGSRGGTGSLLFGVVMVFALTLLMRRQRGSSLRAEALVVLLALATAGVLVGVAMSDVAQADFAQRDLSKLEIVRQAFRLVPLVPIFGAGRGSFETMYPLVREGTMYFTFIRAENFVAQWTIEWGIPATVAACGALAYGLRPATVISARRPAIGAWTALAVGLLHDLVDFHFEVPAVVLLAALCAAIVCGNRSVPTQRRSSAKTTSSPRRYRSIAFVLAAMTVPVSVLVVLDAEHALADDRDTLAELAKDTSVPKDVFRREVRARMLRHPAEPFIALAAAIHFQATREESAVPWIGHALERYSRFGRAHLVLARSLAASRARPQARLEYRLAYGYDSHLRTHVLREAPSLVDDYFSALELVPDGLDGAEMLDSLASALTSRLPSTAAMVDEELARRAPDTTGALRRRVADVMSDLSHDHPWCSDRNACVAPGLTAVESLIVREGEKCEPFVLRAQLLVAAGRARDALDGLTDALERTTERAPCLRALVRLCLETGDKRRADAAFESATRSGCGSRDDCIDLYTWAATTEEARGNFVRAISFHKRAAELAPEKDDFLMSVAQLAERAGLTGEALDAYEKLAVRHPNDSQWRTRADELRANANQRSLVPRP